MMRLPAKLLIYLMIVAVPVSGFAQETSAAMLYANGNFSLNGSLGPRSSAILPGDRIETGNSAAVSITRNGMNVMVGPNSSLVYKGQDIELSSGSAFIATSSNLAAQVHQLRIAPAADNGTFRVARVENGTMIAALKGSVLYNNGGVSATLPEGETVVVPDASAAQRPGAIPGAASPGAGISKRVAAAIAIGALLLTGIIIWTQVDKECGPTQGLTVSPICP
jgi:hypothetical protein